MSLLSVLLALSTPFANIDLPGRYEAVTESEYGIALTLDSDGKARLEFRSWDPEDARSESIDSLTGTWIPVAQGVQITLTGGESVRYSVSPCLSYAEFGAEGCSAGLQLIESTLPEQYELHRFGLWRADSLKVGP